MKAKKIACIYIPHIFVETEKSISTHAKPVVVASGISEKDIIIDFDPALKKEKYEIKKGSYLKSISYLRDKVELVPANYELMDNIKKKLLAFLEEFSPTIESDGYNKYYIDITGTYRLFGRYIDTAANIIQRLRNEFSLTAKAGIGKNILIASTASILAEAGSVYEIAPSSERLFIEQLPLSLIPLFPNSIKHELSSNYNLTKVSEISRLTKKDLLLMVKENGKKLYDFSRGVSRDYLITLPYQKELSIKIIFEAGSKDNDIKKKVFNRIFKVSLELYNLKIEPTLIHVAITYQDNYLFKSLIKRGVKSIHDNSIYNRILPHLNKALKRRVEIKTIVLKLEEFRKVPHQLTLFHDDSEKDNLSDALTSIRKKYGNKYINYGV